MEKKENKRALKEAWFGYEGRYTCVPNNFLVRAANWGLEPIHVLVVMHILMHKWTREHPYPSVATLEKGIGRTRRTIQNAIGDLEVRFKLLKRIARRKADGDHDSNAYDLRPLFEKLTTEPAHEGGDTREGPAATTAAPPAFTSGAPSSESSDDADAVAREVNAGSSTDAEPSHTFKFDVGRAILSATRRLRAMGEYSSERAEWLGSQDLDSAVRKAAEGRPIDKKVVTDALDQLVARAIQARYARREECEFVRSFLRSELGEANVDRLPEILSAATPSRVLAALDAIPKTEDRSEFGRANEAAVALIRAVIPDWRPVAAVLESTTATPASPTSAPVSPASPAPAIPAWPARTMTVERGDMDFSNTPGVG